MSSPTTVKPPVAPAAAPATPTTIKPQAPIGPAAANPAAVTTTAPMAGKGMSSDQAKVLLMYGASGTFKTTQAGFAAEWIYKKYGLKSRLVSAEGWGSIQHLVDGGIIEALNFSSSRAPLAHLRKIAKGYWPGEGPGGTKVMVATPPDDWAKIGLYIFESLDSIAGFCMQHLRETKRTIGQEAVTPFSQEGEDFANSSKAHYGFIQAEMAAMITGVSALPVRRVILTAHEVLAEDEDTKAPIRGPAMVGVAKTGQIAGWVGECLHAESYSAPFKFKDPGTNQEITTLRSLVRYFFVSHPDPKFPNITYPAKPRVPAPMIAKLMEKWPGGYFTPGLEHGLDEYLEMDVQLTQELAEKYQVARKSASDNASVESLPADAVTKFVTVNPIK